MIQTPQERIRTHLALMADTLERYKECPPRTYEELRHHQIAADSAVFVALQLVNELLPADIQAAVTCLVQLHDAVWHCRVEPEGSHEP